MENKTKLFLLVLVVLGALAFVPNLKENIGNAITTSIGPGIADTAHSVETTLSTSPIWQTYGYWLSAAAGGLLVGTIYHFGTQISGALKTTKKKVEKPYMGEPSNVPGYRLNPESNGTSISPSPPPKTSEKESK